MLKPREDFHGMFPGFGQFENRTPNHLQEQFGSLWSKYEKLRPIYSSHHSEISTPAELLATLRAGDVTSRGCYPLFFITSDGAALSFQSVRQELRSVLRSIRHRVNDGWRVVGCNVNWEDSELLCDHSGEPIPSAYGEDE